MEIKNPADLRGQIAIITSLLNGICNSNSSEEIKDNFEKIKHLVTDVANFKLHSIKECK